MCNNPVYSIFCWYVNNSEAPIVPSSSGLLGVLHGMCFSFFKTFSACKALPNKGREVSPLYTFIIGYAGGPLGLPAFLFFFFARIPPPFRFLNLLCTPPGTHPGMRSAAGRVGRGSLWVCVWQWSKRSCLWPHHRYRQLGAGISSSGSLVGECYARQVFCSLLGHPQPWRFSYIKNEIF